MIIIENPPYLQTTAHSYIWVSVRVCVCENEYTENATQIYEYFLKKLIFKREHKEIRIQWFT